MNRDYSALVSRLMSQAPAEVKTITPSGELGPGVVINGEIAARELLLNEDCLEHYVEVVSTQIQYWGRVAAQGLRAWEIRERDYRVWRSQTILKWVADKKYKKTEAELAIRLEPEYKEYYRAMEEAQEAYNAAESVLEGFRAQKDMLRTFARRRYEGELPVLGL